MGSEMCIRDSGRLGRVSYAPGKLFVRIVALVVALGSCPLSAVAVLPAARLCAGVFPGPRSDPRVGVVLVLAARERAFILLTAGHRVAFSTRLALGPDSLLGTGLGAVSVSCLCPIFRAFLLARGGLVIRAPCPRHDELRAP